MKREIIGVFLLMTGLLLIVGLLGFVNADSGNATMTVEANILGFANGNGNVSDVSIQVPDHINLGNVTKDDPVSKEIKIYINNTGKIKNITITPELTDTSEDIFKYLRFRTREQANDTNLNIFYNINDYSLKIPGPSGSKKNEYCYMSLDLTDFDGEINEDLIGYKTNIVFLAMSQ